MEKTLASVLDFFKWRQQAAINAIACDSSLTREQRAAAVVSLRAQQQAAAKAAQQRVVEEEKGNAAAFRRYLRQLSAPR